MTERPETESPNEGRRSPPSSTADVDVLLAGCGAFGRYQTFLSFLLCFPFCFYLAFVVFGQVFLSLEPDHWCRVPELANLSVADRKTLAIPPETEDGRERFSRCRQYDVNWTEVLREDNRTLPPDDRRPTLPCVRGWEYDLDEMYDTPVSRWNWVCEDAWKPYLVQSLFFVGCALGCLVFGHVSDRYGRRPALVASNALACLAGLATAFSRGLVTFAVFRFLVGAACDTCFVTYYILVLEYVPPSRRTLVSNLALGVAFSLSTAGLPWIAYVIWDWKTFAVVTSAPLGAVLLLQWVIPESARWLVARGRIKEALAIVEKMARINGAPLRPETLAQIEKDLSCQREDGDPEGEGGEALTDLFRSPRLRRRTLILFAVWFCIALCYDGQARNTHNLGFGVFHAFTVASATELPASLVVIAALDRIGRRWLSFLSLVVGGCLCVSIAAVPPGMVWPMAVLAMSGRLAINVAFNVGLQYAAELLPTVIRGRGVLATHFVGFLGNVVGPFVVFLAKFGRSLPLLALGSVSVLAGVLCLFLPETLDQALPQTVEEAEAFGSDQRFLHFPCRRHSRETERRPEAGKKPEEPSTRL